MILLLEKVENQELLRFAGNLSVHGWKPDTIIEV